MPGSTGNAIEIANRGQIRFYRKSPSSCAVKLTISYELPDVLVPFGNVRQRRTLALLVNGELAHEVHAQKYHAMSKCCTSRRA